MLSGTIEYKHLNRYVLTLSNVFRGRVEFAENHNSLYNMKHFITILCGMCTDSCTAEEIVRKLKISPVVRCLCSIVPNNTSYVPKFRHDLNRYKKRFPGGDRNATAQSLVDLSGRTITRYYAVLVIMCSITHKAHCLFCDLVLMGGGDLRINILFQIHKTKLFYSSCHILISRF